MLSPMRALVCPPMYGCELSVSAPWTAVSARCDRLRSWQIGRVAIVFGYRLI